MSKRDHLQFGPDVIGYPLLFVMLLWIVFWIESRFGINLNKYGIYPRTPAGLIGIFSGPFIHGSLKHIFNNSIPLFVLSTALFYFYRNIRWKVLLYGLVFTGLATWVIGRPSLHIGASGVLYMLVAFLFFKGIFSKQFQLTALALAVVFLYGGLLWYVFPIDPKISWEGHLSGFFVGLLFAFIFKGVPLENKKYEWEKEGFDEDNDPFLRQFDENGNFVGEPKPEETIEASSESKGAPQVKVTYTITKSGNNYA
ncbi:rhomboid family intramembrane serine protease [Aequorivita sp. H23M31]|uniref:Rhomboid family intramembrane serine protease n=1 Tax=Aequorivita ciconiae TaxID=2494375 RepID=A0A410G2T0_9FLAO|nr:rhomboid family intramembrane serine protease [Aequorivita sp. H23M31]QAA81582.1 rhomboid family intramembrane serine protease [Aequorivita sp. H23M31]